jgi:hypothetical protein
MMTTEATTVTRAELHALVDALPNSELDEAKRYLRGLNTTDPVLRSFLLAPLDDEPETDEEREMVEEAKRALARGEYVTMDEVKRELGFD